MTLSEEEWCRSNCFAFTLRDLYGGWGKRGFFFYTKYSFVIQVYVIHCQQYFSYISWLPVFIGWKKFKNFWEIQLSKCWPMKGQKTQLCSTCNSSPTWSIILICKCQFLSPLPPNDYIFIQMEVSWWHQGWSGKCHVKVCNYNKTTDLWPVL